MSEVTLTITKGITFGPVLFKCTDDAGTPVDLTDWAVFSDARKDMTKPVAFALSAEITDAAAGEITMEKTDEQTAAITAAGGIYRFDVVLENPAGERIGPIAAGTVTLRTIATRP